MVLIWSVELVLVRYELFSFPLFFCFCLQILKSLEFLDNVSNRFFSCLIQWFNTIGVNSVFFFRKLQGKTLAFVLPILESLTNGPAKATRKTGYGRPPSVLVLLPTRELALQV